MKQKVLQLLLLGMFAFFTSNALAQLKVSGVVKSSDGEALPGATVMVKGTTTGVITDIDGKYSITAPQAQSVLVFSFVGMKSQEVSVEGKNTINVTLSTLSLNVDEVVVTALGITKEKKSLAYSVSEVKSDNLVKGGNQNLMKSLDGKVSGVNLTSLSSDPTSSVLVNIRGTTALPTTESNGTNVSMKGQPLYVIDGIPVGTQNVSNKDGVDFGNIISQLNPEDIESITVLKGGSAGALYGKDGGNGVVMITTKSGKGGKAGIGVSFTSSFTVEQPYQFIQEQQLYGQGERANEWQYDNTDTWGPRLDGSYTGRRWNVKTQQWDDNVPMVASGENPMKAYLRNGSTFTNNVGITGNYDKGSFRVSLSSMGNDGVMPNTTTQQKSVNFASEYKLTDKIKVSVNSNFVTTYSPNKANVAGSNSVLNDLLVNIPASLQPLSEMKNYWLKGFEGLYQNGAIMKDKSSVPIYQAGVAQNNPWFITYERIHRFNRNNFFGKVQLDWQFSKSLSALVRSGMESVVENYELRKSWGDKGDPYGEFQMNESNSNSFNTDALLNFNKAFGKFSVTASGGFNYTFNKNYSSYIDAGDLTVPKLFNVANAKPGTLSAKYGSTNLNDDYGFGTSQSYSAYGTADFSWANTFFLGVTGRNDWLGFLDENKMHYFYPSVSASWVASQSLALPKAIDLLKFRLGYADVGNGLIRPRSVDTWAFESNDWNSSVKTANVTRTLVDPNIKATHSLTKEAGVDIWAFDKRIQFDFTYFIKDQVDQFGQIPTVQGTGFTGMTTNIGDVRNKGFEIGFTYNPVRTKDWNWDIAASLTHYKATITRLSDKFAPNGFVFASYDGKTVVKIAEGEEVGNIYEQNPILKVKSGKYAGQYLLDGEAGEFQTSSDVNDRQMLGNFNPKYLIGINTTLRYKQFTLNIVGGLRVGGKYVSVNQQYMDSNGRSVESLSSGPNNPLWNGGRDASQGGNPWPTIGASSYAAINANNDPQHSDVADAGYAKGVFIRPDLPDGATPSDADYIVNGADKNNTFYQFAYNSFGDCIWNFASTRTFDATNFKLREVSLTYTIPNSVTQKYYLNGVYVSIIGRNLFQWNASGRNEDPESAFSGVGTSQGILRGTLPSIRSVGFKLGFNF
ncbi:MAG TPA: SusC/RagA family TonB-linked outer membrane protein [Prolixibacteraceae bacterium]|nr:SusC/RagA family TonB-linked outer membrane protein [Prolixibacteraceae bacterium]